VTCFLKAGPLPKQKGEVKWFDPRKRYGFIVTEEGEDVFVHQHQILGSDAAKPHEGQMVRFHVQQSSKGPEALNVELL
jgi:CspA family cold shock protein